MVEVGSDSDSMPLLIFLCDIANHEGTLQRVKEIFVKWFSYWMCLEIWDSEQGNPLGIMFIFLINSIRNTLRAKCRSHRVHGLGNRICRHAKSFCVTIQFEPCARVELEVDFWVSCYHLGHRVNVPTHEGQP